MSAEYSHGSLSQEQIEKKMWEQAKVVLEEGKSYTELYTRVNVHSGEVLLYHAARNGMLAELGGSVNTYTPRSKDDIVNGVKYTIVTKEYPLTEWPEVIAVSEDKIRHEGTPPYTTNRVFLKRP